MLAKSKNPALRQASKYALWELKECQRHLLESSILTRKEHRDAGATLTNLEEDAPVADDSAHHHPGGCVQVMVSYQWDSQDLAVKLKGGLIDAGFDVWMDVDRMSKVLFFLYTITSETDLTVSFLAICSSLNTEEGSKQPQMVL